MSQSKFCIFPLQFMGFHIISSNIMFSVPSLGFLYQTKACVLAYPYHYGCCVLLLLLCCTKHQPRKEQTECFRKAKINKVSQKSTTVGHMESKSLSIYITTSVYVKPCLFHHIFCGTN